MPLLDRTAARYDGAIVATLTGVIDRIRQRGEGLDLEASDRLDGRTCLVTGANRGLGLATAHALAARGASLILACRSGAEAARAEVSRSAARSDDVRTVSLDLGELASVERCLRELSGDGTRVHVAILNAGIVPREARRTADGFDESFQVNFLANAFFARGLLDRGIVQPAGESTAPRMVIVSSESHRSAPAIDWSAAGVYQPWGIRQAVEQYGYGKLLLQTFTEELARRHTGSVSVHSLCPGAVRTDIGREAPEWVKPALALTMRAFFQAPERAALPVVYLAAARAIEGQTGIYLHGRRRRAPSELATDPRSGAAAWRTVEDLLGSTGYTTSVQNDER
jgi:NAD(P)-dependent dehydrogenase (short-subunit alcohol dehydrogenase family)